MDAERFQQLEGNEQTGKWLFEFCLAHKLSQGEFEYLLRKLVEFHGIDPLGIRINRAFFGACDKSIFFQKALYLIQEEWERVEREEKAEIIRRAKRRIKIYDARWGCYPFWKQKND